MEDSSNKLLWRPRETGALFRVKRRVLVALRNTEVRWVNRTEHLPKSAAAAAVPVHSSGGEFHCKIRQVGEQCGSLNAKVPQFITYLFLAFFRYDEFYENNPGIVRDPFKRVLPP